MKYSLTSLILASSALSASAATIVNEVGDLNFSYTGGASESSSSATTLAIQTSKNSAAYASLPSAYDLNLGETISVTLDFTLSNTVVNTSSSIDLGFSNSGVPASVGGTMWDGTFDYTVQLDPVTTGNGIQFKDGDNTNLGKFNTDQAFGTSTHTLSFTLERTGAEEITLSFQSPTISSTTRSATSSAATLTTSIVDTFGFTFRGNAWNEDFGGSTAVATVTNFSIDTTASPVPEPSSFALLAGIGVLALAGVRRRSRA